MTVPEKRALIVIDIQNDYFASGAYPQWNAEETLATILSAVAAARKAGSPVVLVQHVADVTKGIAPFFNPGTPGVAIHPAVMAAAPDAPVVVKSYADSFHHTDLAQVLTTLGVEELLLCGMMTHNCVTHTALSKTAEAYRLAVLSDCCTSVSQMIHRIALNALAVRIPLIPSAEAF